jgi:hypothetical protein
VITDTSTISLYKQKNYSELIYILEGNSSLNSIDSQILADCYFKTGSVDRSYFLLKDNLERHLFDKSYFDNFIKVTTNTKEFYTTVSQLIGLLKKNYNLRKNIKDFHLLEIAKLYYINNKHHLSNKYYGKLLQLNTTVSKAFIHFHLGKNYYELNDKVNGEKYVRLAIKENQSIGEFHRYLSMNKKFKESNDQDIITMKSIFSKDDKSIHHVNLGFALAKAHEDVNNYQESARYLQAANSLMHSFVKYDHKQTLLEINNLKQIYLKNFLKADFHNFGYPRSNNIFIVGMPRSGTTLLEQIISSHPKVYNGGELTYFSKYFNKKFNQVSQNSLEGGLSHFHQLLLKEIGEGYASEIFKKTKKTCTDKMPFNFIYLGFIKQALPNSKIVHISRNRNDNCLSIYKNFFATQGIQFAYDELSINQYYDAYLDLMGFWRTYCKEFFLDITYEDLATDSENTIKTIIKFCELEWHDNCLQHHQNKSFVKTLSVAQAREKIYNSSVNHYKHFKDYLPNLFI